jgi:His-Xaa-Ser system radical SAM maturase HxsB
MSKFQTVDFYRSSKADYSLLPFRFTELDDENYVLSNIAGEYLVASKSVVPDLINHRLDPDHPTYVDLRARHFLVDDKTSIASELLAIKLRTKYTRLSEFTGLHIFVVSLRCEHSCPYCQVSRQSQDKQQYDMTQEMASKAIDLTLRSPSANIKIEFQGGEPLLNFDLIKYIVLEARKRNQTVQKNLAFVIATNLALVTEEILLFCREHSIDISTSLDGPPDLHNANRPRPGKNSYEKATEGIRLARRILGRDRVSALMTTTEASLSRVKEIIDEYLALEFKGIFLRPLSPYGFAIKTKSYRSYTTARWLEFYKQGIEYIVELNRLGLEFTEYYASTILKKMLTCDDPGYVDLMSPAGIGIGAVVYNYDGSVYASDESRMLAEMGEEKFRLGNVLENTYEEIFTSPNLLDPLEESFAYSVPMCNDCAFEPYCGADPVYHYGLQKDYVGRKPVSDFCLRSMETCRFLIQKMESDPFVKKVFTTWATRGC